MNRDELLYKLRELSQKCEKDFPHAAVILLITSGSYLEHSEQELGILVTDWAAERIKFMTLDGR